MARMVRKQVYITEEQEQFLKQRAQELGVTESDLIRESIDRMDTAPMKPSPDERAWEESLAFMRERGRLAVPQHGPGQGRGWTREELYDERPKNWASRR